MKKILLIILLLIPVIVNGEEISLAPNSKSSILIEVSTGNVIFEKNADEKLAPASMTKMMSMLLIIEAIESNVISWNQMITVSKNASSMGGSQILLETGEQMSVEDLFKGVAIASGNDAVVALAESVAGTTSMFVSMMNDKAKKLGLTNTQFKNPHGLDEEGHYSSARDMSIIARELVKHEKVLEYTSIYETYLRENLDTKAWLVNTNKLVRFKKGVDGLKTGYTNSAKYCLTATMKNSNMRLIAVVMGEEDANTRNSEASEMLDYGFAQYDLDVLLTTNSELKSIRVPNGDKKYLTVVPTSDITILKRKMDTKITPTYKMKLDKIILPVKNNEVIGKLYVYDNDKVIKEINLTVKEPINKINIFKSFYQNIIEIFSGNIDFTFF